MTLFSAKADTVFFAQVACTALGGDRGEYMQKKRYLGLLESVIGLLICVVFKLTIESFKTQLSINEKVLDYELVSIEDYAVTGSIKEEFYRHALTQAQTTHSNAVAIAAFKSYLIEKI